MFKQERDVFAILLAGGSGTRLWPVSRERYPKQLVSFIGGDSLVQSTVKRLIPAIDQENIRVVCGEEHVHEIFRHMNDIGVPAEGKLICEPCGRNTAPAILLATLKIIEDQPDAVICVFPADHVIRDIPRFHEKLTSALRLARSGHVVTFGITPHYPETGYGYIEGGAKLSEAGLKIERFVEKPDVKTAETYMAAGNFFWNSGMFAFKASVIMDQFRRFSSELLGKMKEILSENGLLTRENYERLPNISIDYAIMERTDTGVVLPSDFGWSDIGSWKSLYDFLPKDENHNVLDGDVLVERTENCFILGHERLIATNNIRNMVVVETPDSVFVSDIDSSRDVKSIVTRLRNKGRSECHKHRTEHHLWGSVTLLEQKEGYAVLRREVYPNAVFRIDADRLTRMHLVVVQGRARIFSDHVEKIIEAGGSAVVHDSTGASVENAGSEMLCFIQTSWGIARHDGGFSGLSPGSLSSLTPST